MIKESKNLETTIATSFEEATRAHKSGDYKTSVKEFKLAAKQGHALAQYNLGVIYANGEGVLKRPKTAAKWYALAADQGNALAQYFLGAMYANGDGVLENHETSEKWYALAAGQGLFR